MQRAVLLGHPVAHSISPIFQQAAFEHLRLNVRYEAWDILPAGFAGAVERLRGAAFLGANVTLPYKERVLEQADDISPEARLAGAANTLVNQGGRLLAGNSDIDGFLLALRGANFDPQGCHAVVLGAGGAARAVVVALISSGAERITVRNRSLERAERLITSLKAASTVPLAAASLNSQHAAELAHCDILVNCTSVGMAGSALADQSPLPEAELPEAALVVDIVANPTWTPLLRHAHRRGCATLGGLAMLVWQGARSFTLWTGQAAPVEVMMQAARAAMDLEERRSAGGTAEAERWFGAF